MEVANLSQLLVICIHLYSVGNRMATLDSTIILAPFHNTKFRRYSAKLYEILQLAFEVYILDTFQMPPFA